MRLSRYFMPILRDTPKEAEIASHRLMLRAGMMRQESAGIYALLPLGLRVLNKITGSFARSRIALAVTNC
jgi:prolyl-tRNA synthetase